MAPTDNNIFNDSVVLDGSLYQEIMHAVTQSQDCLVRRMHITQSLIDREFSFTCQELKAAHEKLFTACEVFCIELNRYRIAGFNTEHPFYVHGWRLADRCSGYLTENFDKDLADFDQPNTHGLL